MRKIWEWIKSNPNRTMFLVPILLVAVISISHVVSWYNIANPLSWAIYLSIAIEVGAMTALVAATNKIKGGVWFMFGLVTFIQMVGNIFFTYKEIDPNGDLFKSWVELTGPVWEMIGSDPSDIPSMKRWLSFLEGGLLPIISLTSLHFFVKYEKVNPTKEDIVHDEVKVTDQVTDQVNDQVPTKYRPSTNQVIDTKEIWDRVNQLRKEGKLPEWTEEEIMDEPTALANSQYRLEEESIEDEKILSDDIIETYLFAPQNEEPKTEDVQEDEVRRLTYTKKV
jgi:hypothetical protein